MVVPDSRAVPISREEFAALSTAWQQRMVWAASWLEAKGFAKKIGRPLPQDLRVELAECGVERPERFHDKVARLLIEWGRREWESMVFELDRQKNSALTVAEIRSAVEWPSHNNVASSVEGFFLQRMPNWEKQYRFGKFKKSPNPWE